MKKDKKTYYFGIRIANNSTQLSTSKENIANFIGIHECTVRRHLSHSSVYINNKYIIGKCLGINRIQRGFALK